MARKSRKNIMPQSAAPEIRISEEVNLLRTAAYARLSSENSGHETEDTLNTQILQIHNYIKEHPELTLTDTYVDNGFTGTNFDRPEFERMMQDVRTGKIQCIVVKDLSRFGRDYIETGNYLETIFPMLHIRFIAINDDFDNIRQSDVDSLAVPIKNMVNSLYAKDISKKIGLSYQMRREKGIPTSWCVPYGYRMNEQKSQYEVADEAKYVKLIYQWYLMGLSTNEIARRLEFLEVPRPNEHLNRRLHEGHDTTFNKWHSSSVLRILDSQAYIGNLVTGKTRTASYKGIGLHPVDKEEWHIVENAHEAIIMKSDFEIVQEKRNRNKEKRNNAMARSEQVRAECRNHFAGMVFCGCCRRNMTFVRQVHKTEEERYFGVFQCKRKKGTTPCSYHTVPEKMLMMVAMDQIHHLVSTMCEEEKLVKDMMRGSNLDSARSIKMKEKSILFRIHEAEERRLRLYEDYKAEILDEDEYSQLKEHYIAEKQRLEHELQKQRQRALELEKRIKICDAQMERMRGILNQNEFDEELNKHARTIKSYLDEEDYGKENEDTDNQEFDEYDESSGYETPEDDEGFDGFSDDELLVGDERDNVKLGAFDGSDLKEYVKGQCEIMEDAGRHIEMIMEEYSQVSERFADIELYENAPDNLKDQIAKQAELVDNLAVDRRILKNSESKLSNNAYNRMDMYAQELPKSFRFIQQQETYYETVKRDLQSLEGERMALRMEAKNLKKKHAAIKKAAIIVLACLAVVYSIFTIVMVALDNEDELYLFFVVTFLGAIVAVGIFAWLSIIHRQASAVEIKINKITAALNKIKIKYVNAANVLSYEYDKYKIKSSYELGRKFELYLQMKEERKHVLMMTANLNDAENKLLMLLKRIGISDTVVWLSQTKGLYIRNEMVEIRHELAARRKKLRNQIEYNEGRIEEAKYNIRKVNKLHPEYTKETLEILDEYEKRSIN